MPNADPVAITIPNNALTLVRILTAVVSFKYRRTIIFGPPKPVKNRPISAIAKLL